jgi:hypothetical protein
MNPALARTAGLAAVFAFPLRHGAMRLGALDLYRDTPGVLSRSSLFYFARPMPATELERLLQSQDALANPHLPDTTSAASG